MKHKTFRNDPGAKNEEETPAEEPQAEEQPTELPDSYASHYAEGGE